MITYNDVVHASHNFANYVFTSHPFDNEKEVERFRKIDALVLNNEDVSEDDCEFIRYWANDISDSNGAGSGELY